MNNQLWLALASLATVAATLTQPIFQGGMPLGQLQIYRKERERNCFRITGRRTFPRSDVERYSLRWCRRAARLRCSARPPRLSALRGACACWHHRSRQSAADPADPVSTGRYSGPSGSCVVAGPHLASSERSAAGGRWPRKSAPRRRRDCSANSPGVLATRRWFMS